LDSLIEFTNCTFNSLYLDDTGKTTTCALVNDTSNNLHYVPYQDTANFWQGTFDGEDGSSNCYRVPIPNCTDALSDVPYVGIETKKYLWNSLNVFGGLHTDAAIPQTITASVHFVENARNFLIAIPFIAPTELSLESVIV
jgi:hypothetical protein